MLASIIPTGMNLVIFIVILGLAILVHEAGHFVVARWFKIAVEEFAIGFGPKLFTWKWWGTLFTIRAIPLGGFNKIVGEGERVKQKNSYSERPFRQKLAVLVAGATMNVLLAIVIAYLMLFMTGFKATNPLPQIQPPAGAVDFDESNRVVVVSIAEWSTLAQEKIELPIIISSIDKQTIVSTKQVQEYLAQRPNAEITLQYKEIPAEAELITDVDVSKDLKQVQVSVNEEGRIGIGFLDTTARINYGTTLGGKLTSGVAHNVNMLYISYKVLGNLVEEAVRTRTIAPVGDSVVGIVGFYKAVDLTREADGFIGLLNLTALLNLNLGIMNLLPIPTLDGGHIIIRLVERIRRKRFSDDTVGIINLVGLLGLIILAVVITVKDIRQFF